jgi:hypothetical protein
MMFQPRSTQFDPRITAIVNHLRAIEGELGGIGKSAGRRASVSASAAGNQIAEAIGPILNDIVERFRRGQRVALDEAVDFGGEAVKFGSRVGNDALDRVAAQAKSYPLLTVAVAIGAGVLIGMAGRRSRR